jgi:hypothetical protein
MLGYITANNPILLSVPTFEFWKTVHIIMDYLYVFPVLPSPLNCRIFPHENNPDEHCLFAHSTKNEMR